MREAMLILHFLGVALLLGTGFAYAILEFSNSNLEPDERTSFTLKIKPLSRLGHIGITFLLISGGYLMTPYWQALGSMPLLITKLALVALMIFAVIVIALYSKKAKKSQPEYYFKKIIPYSQITFYTGIAIVILAVLVFH